MSGPEAGVLVVDQVQPLLVQHQVAAVVVAMAQDARLGGEALDQQAQFDADRDQRALVEFDAAIPEQVVLEEELHLPSELGLVEGDAVRQVDVRREFRAAMLQRGNEPHRFAIQLAVFLRTGEAEVGLQRDVAEILEQQQPEIRRFVEDVGHRHRHLIEQSRHVQERQAVVERPTGTPRAPSSGPRAKSGGNSADPRRRP